jgi:hypothetical protein
MLLVRPVLEQSQPGGTEARIRLQSLIESEKLRIEPVGRDRYGRTLAYIYVDGRRLVQSDISQPGGRGHNAHGQSGPRQFVLNRAGFVGGSIS